MLKRLMPDKKFAAWLFDLDGTLADTAKDLSLALNHVLKLKNRPVLSEKTVRPYAAFGSRYLIELGFGKNQDKDGLLKNLLLDYYEDNIAVETRLFPGIDQVLKQLEKHKIKWGVVTNKPERFTLPLLKKLKIFNKAKVIVSGNTYNNSKPHPQPILHACKVLDVNPENTLYIGDSMIDLKACQAAGVDMILAEYGYLQKDDRPDTWEVYARINQAEELLKFI